MSACFVVDTKINAPEAYEKYNGLAKLMRLKNAECTRFLVDGA